MSGTRDGGRQGRALRLRLRIAALIALAAGVLFLIIEASYRPSADLHSLLIGWTVHTLLAVVAIVASYRRLSFRVMDRLVVCLILSNVVHAYLYMLRPPHNPAVVACGLVCLLVIGPVFFSWSDRRTALMAGLTCVAFALVGSMLPPEQVKGGPVAVAFGALVVGSGLAVASARVLNLLRASLARRRRELGALSARLMSVQEEERRRLSRELHDEFGQSLTAVSAYLWLIERQLPADGEKLRAQAAEARRVVTGTLGAMRELSQLLRPSVLDEFGLVPSLDSHLKTFTERHQIAISFDAQGLPERLPPEMETALYRIAQEALTNVVRHARAQRVRIALSATKRELRLDIEDDGIGFPARQANGGRSGTGLVGIRERARALGGTVTLSSGKGARLRVTVPLRSAAPPAE
jgi:signal transduction histidine kinase